MSNGEDEYKQALDIYYQSLKDYRRQVDDYRESTNGLVELYQEGVQTLEKEASINFRIGLILGSAIGVILMLILFYLVSG